MISTLSSLNISLLHLYLLLAASSILLFVAGVFLLVFKRPKVYQDTLVELSNYCKFFYVSFLKPHTGDGLGGQQGALESFYKAQASLVFTDRWDAY